MTRFNRAGAASFLTKNGLPIAANTLAKRAVKGSGPLYQIWNGEATYEEKDLLDWAEVELGPKLRSTAERNAKGAPPNVGRA